MTVAYVPLQHVPLQVDVTGAIEDFIADLLAILPEVVGAIVVLVIGWIVGRIAGGLVSRLTDRVGLDRTVLETPIGRIFGGTERSVSRALGMITRWFVYALAILAAANVLALPLLSEWISIALAYLPAFVAGLLVILLGFVLADFVGDAMMRTRGVTRTGYTSWFATGTRLFLYFTAIVIGLDTMGVDVSILYVFARAISWGLAAAIAIGVGVAVGWGGKDYVHDNISRWMGSAREQVPETEREPTDD